MIGRKGSELFWKKESLCSRASNVRSAQPSVKE